MKVANMHLTCTNIEAAKVDEALSTAMANGIRNIVALRGDAPAGQEKWEATEGGFNCALDLVKHIRAKFGGEFCISVAGYPEGHPDKISLVEGGVGSLSASEKRRCSVAVGADGQEVVQVCRDADFAAELAYLKEKVDAGADFILTQVRGGVGTAWAGIGAGCGSMETRGAAGTLECERRCMHARLAIPRSTLL